MISRKSHFFDSIDAVTNDEPQRYKEGIEAIQHRHSSYSGMGRTEFSGSPKLKRLCSHLETMDMLKMIAGLRISVRDERSKFTQGIQPRSLLSVMTCCSGDSVILRQQLSIQALPSRSRTLCWNLYKPVTWSFSPQNTSNQNYGYSSDTLETSCARLQSRTVALRS